MAKFNFSVIDSEAISSIHYDDEVEELTVEINPSSKGRARLLVYGQVPKKVFENFRDAESKGGFFNHHVRGVYPYLGEITK